jgi:hypothetical protein
LVHTNFYKADQTSFTTSASNRGTHQENLSEEQMFRLLRTVPLALVLAALSLFTASCGSSSAKFRMVYTVPNGVAVDVLIDGKAVETNVSVNSVTPSSGYLSVSSGSRHLQVFPTGTTSGAYFDGTVSFGSGTSYTFLLTGPTTTIQHQLITDNNTAPTSSNAELRVIQASPTGLSGLQSLDIYLSTANTQTLGQKTISGVAYPTASTYVTFPASTYAFLVTPANLAVVEIDVPQASFSGGKIYTYVLYDVSVGQISQSPLVLNDN